MGLCEQPNILVVEDDERLRELLARILATAGYTVLTAEHGRDAVKLLASNKVQIILTSLMMPEMDGIELTRFVHQEYPDVKVVIFGSSLDDLLLKVARHLGARASFAMPISPNRLIALVEAIRSEDGNSMSTGAG